ncbi:MAG: repressor LexA [Candidatus Omnitrophica bacterium]|nr:repressor LexA [Candidatus Omnitrophota bacterium]
MPKPIDLNQAVRQIRKFSQENKRPPSFDELRKLFRYKSKNAAFWLVDKLIDSGFLKKDKQGKILFDSFNGVRLLGTVQAGWPSPAEEELADVMSLDEYLIKHPDQTFLIKVSGDSMIDAGIHAGDLVLVERGRQPKHQDIVIAEVDNEWTMKYYEKNGKEVRLVAANKKYPPIKPREELKIGGVIVAVIRKYK